VPDFYKKALSKNFVTSEQLHVNNGKAFKLRIAVEFVGFQKLRFSKRATSN